VIDDLGLIRGKNLTQKSRRTDSGERRTENGERRTENGMKNRKEKKKGEESKETTLIAEPAIENGRIRIDAAVAEKRPVTASVLAFGRIALDDQDFFLVV